VTGECAPPASSPPALTSPARPLDALVGAPRAFLDEGRLIHPSHAHVRDLAARRRARPVDHFPLAGLVGESVADLELHREEPRRG